MSGVGVGGNKSHARKIDTSEVVVDFQRHFPKDCYFPSGFSLDLSTAFSVGILNGISFL